MTLKNIGIVAFDQAEVLDVMGPFEVFSVAGRLSSPSAFQVSVVADAATKNVTLRHNLKIVTDSSIFDNPDFDLIVVAGGITQDAEKNHELLNWLKSKYESGATVASICTGAFILAEAGILSSGEVTTHWEDQAELGLRFPRLQVIPNKRWIRNQDTFTSGGISAGIDLSLHLVEVLASRELALATARQMEFRWEDETWD
jgi:transcriptional regulator GlxA family with amidase domain